MDWLDREIKKRWTGITLQPTGMYREKIGAHSAMIIREASAVMRRRPTSRMAQHLGLTPADYSGEPTAEECREALRMFEQANGFETEFSYS